MSNRVWAAVAGAVFAGAACVFGGWLAVACVPDLVVTPDPGLPRCGDGIIDLAAGEACDPGDGGVSGCTADCRVECDGGFIDTTSNHCYFALPRPYGFIGARTACSYDNGHVVTFASPTELARVYGASRGFLPEFWVGLNNRARTGWISEPLDEPGWTPDQCPGCYAETIGNLFPNAVDVDPAAPAQCVKVAGVSQAPWIGESCSAVIRTLCEREPPGVLSRSCDAGTCISLKATILSKRYIFVDQPSTADDAVAYCAAFPNAHLWTIESPEAREQLWRELTQVDPQARRIWTGLSWTDAAGWGWDDDASVESRSVPWGERQPDDAGKSRAFADLQVDQADSQLVRNRERAGEPRVTLLPFVCELPAESADAGL